MMLLPQDEGTALPPIDETSSDSTGGGSGGGTTTVFSLESEMDEIIAETGKPHFHYSCSPFHTILLCD